MPIVSDSGPIISFAKTNHFELLRRVTDELAVPAAVYDEIVIKGAGKVGAKATAAADWIKRMEVQDRTLIDQLPRKLHLGEREALALAVELIDDYRARQEAKRLGIRYFGILKVLEYAKDRKLIPKVKPVLNDLIAAGAYLSPALYREFLAQMGES